MSTSIVYKVNKKIIKEAYLAYVSEEIYFWEDRPPSKARLNSIKIPTLPSGWLTLKQIEEIDKKHARWLSFVEEDYCVPFCAWCHYVRNPLADDNEHEECDACLHYNSEAGKPEQEATLVRVAPALPTVALKMIMSYL